MSSKPKRKRSFFWSSRLIKKNNHNDATRCASQPMAIAWWYRLLQCKPVFHWMSIWTSASAKTQLGNRWAEIRWINDEHLQQGLASVGVTVVHLCRWILWLQEEHYCEFNLFSTESARQENQLSFLLWLTANWNHHNSLITSPSSWHFWPEIQLPS